MSSSRMKCIDLIPTEKISNQPISFRSSPFLLILSDLFLILKQLPYLPYIFLPLEISLSPPFINLDSTPLGLLFQVFLFLNSFFVLLLLGISLWVFPILALPFIALQTQFLLFLQGPILIPPSASKKHPLPKGHEDETFFFTNGIATSKSGAKLAIVKLQNLFGRPVYGIYNPTLGILDDLVECVLQRDLSYATEDLRKGYPQLKAALQDEKKKKVVLIGHSQGGIVISAWVDQLLADTSASDLSKLEIYTFASAANHLSSPLNLFNERAIKHVEHFANEKDFVSRIGVLAFVTPSQVIKSNVKPSKSPSKLKMNGFIPKVQETTRFYGRLFERKNVGGHLLLEHYLGGNSILEDPVVKERSRLVRYLGGLSPED